MRHRGFPGGVLGRVQKLWYNKKKNIPKLGEYFLMKPLSHTKEISEQ